mmetsp:Transcript_18806/g.55920  ORF Transcript_18806/g.55920 Transcript_18806/m.55920 type:complete len:243 (-) Transcript_18806:18-746(-)
MADPAQFSSGFSYAKFDDIGDSDDDAPCRTMTPYHQMGQPPKPTAWAHTCRSPEEQRRWLVDCYRVRRTEAGGEPFPPGGRAGAATRAEAIEFLLFCKLAAAARCLPEDCWQWPPFLEVAAQRVHAATTYEAASAQYAPNDVFAALTGGRDFRHTAKVIYGEVGQPGQYETALRASMAKWPEKGFDVFDGDGNGALGDVGHGPIWKQFLEALTERASAPPKKRKAKPVGETVPVPASPRTYS